MTVGTSIALGIRSVDPIQSLDSRLRGVVVCFMKISFMTQAYADTPFEKIVPRLAKVGYDGVEPLAGPEGQLKPSELKDSDRRELGSLLTEHGMTIPVLNPYRESMVNMAKEGIARDFYGAIMELAVDLGTPTVNCLSGFFADGDREGWKILIDFFKELTRHAESIGICLSIHNHEANILDTVEKCTLMIEHVGSPNLKVTFDATNCYLLNVDVPQAAVYLGPHLNHCHLKGIKGKYPFTHFLVPGEEGDEMDFEALASALATVGYDGYISVETFPHMRDDKDRIAYEMMSSTLAGLGLS